LTGTTRLPGFPQPFALVVLVFEGRQLLHSLKARRDERGRARIGEIVCSSYQSGPVTGYRTHEETPGVHGKEQTAGRK